MDPVMAICTGAQPYPACTRRTSTAGNPAEVGATVPRGAADQLKLSPQAQLLPALGLSIVKPCFSMVSAKSIVAPSR